MNKKTYIILVEVILLGLGTLGIWSYLSFGNMTFTKLVYLLKLNGFAVEDISEQVAAKYPNTNKPDGCEAKVIDVNEEQVVVFIGSAETLQSILEEEKATIQNPLIEWVNKPHLYSKDSIVVLYVGMEEKLLKTFDKIFGEASDQ